MTRHDLGRTDFLLDQQWNIMYIPARMIILTKNILKQTFTQKQNIIQIIYAYW